MFIVISQLYFRTLKFQLLILLGFFVGFILYVVYSMLHASENPSSILCVVSGHIVPFYIKPIFRHCLFYYVK